MNQSNHIHLLGICGTGMGALADLLVQAGHKVTGTDDNVYPPMSDQLAARGIPIFKGYAAENLKKPPNMVIVGNALSKTNPEVQEMLRLGLPYRSMPAALAEFFLKTRTPLVVTGTHGKTTTATLLAWLLTKAGEDPGYLIGGIGKNLGKSSAIGSGPFFVVEGDEYDTAFFDKGPKFLHYRPQAAILTSIEFDHADIYRNLDHLCESFRHFITLLPPDGLLIACGDSELVMTLTSHARCRVISYGMVGNVDYKPTNIVVDHERTTFDLATPLGVKRFSLPMFGDHNVSNATAALALLLESGIKASLLEEGMESFSGVKRRQEVIGTVKTVTVIDDFAHHPTAVAKTIAAMRHRYPGRRLWAIFEPRSNTSRRNVFQQEFATALLCADRVVVAKVFHPEKIPEQERLDAQQLADTVMQRGTDAHYVPDTDHIVEYVIRNTDAHDVILIMSNGGFDGIHGRLLAALEHRNIHTDPSKLTKSRIPKRPVS